MKSSIDVTEAVHTLSKHEITSLAQRDRHIEYLKSLNEGQQIAATCREGNYLVIAGPGTGKTLTLVYRCVHLVRTGVDPQSLVVITFTRKAGNELKHRLNLLLPNTSLGFVGTFHAFSNHISQLMGSASPISKFRLLDPEDDVMVHKLVCADFPDFNKNIRAKRLQKIMSYCANTGLNIPTYIKTFDLHDLNEDIDNLQAYQKAYDSYKVNHMLANYDDMITSITQYLKEEGGKKLVAPFEYLMIDEYQDTNLMQLDFVKTLNIQNVMAIGDDFQGIYGFRGADHRIILNFTNDFKGAAMVKLTENYRSNDQIVGWVNDTIKKSSLGYHKALTSATHGQGVVKVISGESLAQHKDFILGNIKANPSEKHALIYRYNKNRTVFEKAMIEADIDYTVYGGIRLLERKHIKDVFAFLMVSLNRLDVVSYSRILTMLPGIGPKSAKKLIKDDLADISHLKGLKFELVDQIKRMLADTGSKEDLFRQVKAFYFSIYAYVESEFYSKEEIEEDFRLIQELLETFDSLHNFIVNLILDPVVDMHKGKQPKVVLTTIHSAKGLEFDNVYYFHSHDWYKNYDIEALEEDRRLFYVGISRAKKNLYLFDHTEVKRTFDEILRDFDNGAKALEPVDVYANLGQASNIIQFPKQPLVVDEPHKPIEVSHQEIIEEEAEDYEIKPLPNVPNAGNKFNAFFEDARKHFKKDH